MGETWCTHRRVHVYLIGSAESVRVSGSRRQVEVGRMLSILVIAVWLELVALLEGVARRRRSVWTCARISARVSARVSARIHAVAVFVYAGFIRTRDECKTGGAGAGL